MPQWAWSGLFLKLEPREKTRRGRSRLTRTNWRFKKATGSLKKGNVRNTQGIKVRFFRFLPKIMELFEESFLAAGVWARVVTSPTDE